MSKNNRKYELSTIYHNKCVDNVDMNAPFETRRNQRYFTARSMQNAYEMGWDNCLENLDENIKIGNYAVKDLKQYNTLYSIAFTNIYSKKYPSKVYKTKTSDNEFIVIVYLLEGKLMNKYEIKYWDNIKCRELETIEDDISEIDNIKELTKFISNE